MLPHTLINSVILGEFYKIIFIFIAPINSSLMCIIKLGTCSFLLLFFKFFFTDNEIAKCLLNIITPNQLLFTV